MTPPLNDILAEAVRIRGLGAWEPTDKATPGWICGRIVADDGCAVAVAISPLEMLQNNKEQFIDLLCAKMKLAERTLRNTRAMRAPPCEKCGKKGYHSDPQCFGLDPVSP